MSEFVTGLRAELVAAAEREERRGTAARAALGLRPFAPALALATLLLLAAVLAVAHFGGGDGRQTAKPHSQAKPLFGGTVTAGVPVRTQAFFVPLELRFPNARWLATAVETDFIALALQPGDPNTRPTSFLYFSRSSGRVWDPRHPHRLLPAPRDLFGFLAAHPDVDAKRPQPATLAGHRARVMDLTFRFKRPLRSALYCQGQGFRCTQLGPGDLHPEGERDRVWEVQTRRGPLYVFVVGWDAAAFRDTINATQPILSTLKIDD